VSYLAGKLVHRYGPKKASEDKDEWQARGTRRPSFCYRRKVALPLRGHCSDLKELPKEDKTNGKLSAPHLQASWSRGVVLTQRHLARSLPCPLVAFG